MIDPRFILEESPFWTWSLFANQSYIGRVQMTLRRECHGSIADLTDEEWKDLRASIQAYEIRMTARFQPDRFNYVQLGNVWSQVHVHAIPRYAESRTWNGILFNDTRWGDVPLPEPASPISEDQALSLLEDLKYLE